ncbi:MAG: hypothetical protein ACT4P2_16880 [Pseudomonadota bacterium]
MKAFVVDTNVPVAANGRETHTDIRCRLRCIERLREIMERGRIVIDDDGRILSEYRPYFDPSGPPGTGDAFFKYLWDNQANPAKCVQVRITELPHNDHDFAEFPRDPDLAEFDFNDRKFVAVALASGLRPAIQNATDTDWWFAREALFRNGVRLNFCAKS